MSKPRNNKPNGRRRFLLAAAAAGTAASTFAGAGSAQVREAPLSLEQQKLISIGKRHGSELGISADLPSRFTLRRG